MSVVKKIKKYIPGMGPKFDKELNKVWQGTFFSWMNLHPEQTLEQCVDAANKAVVELMTTRDVVKNSG